MDPRIYPETKVVCKRGHVPPNTPADAALFINVNEEGIITRANASLDLVEVLWFGRDPVKYTEASFVDVALFTSFMGGK